MKLGRVPTTEIIFILLSPFTAWCRIQAELEEFNFYEKNKFFEQRQLGVTLPFTGFRLSFRVDGPITPA